MKILEKRLFLSLSLLLWQPLSWAAEGDLKTPAAAPPSPLGGETIFQVLMGLALVLVAVVFCAWLMRRLLRMQPGGADGQLRILAALSMGTRERVVLLEVGDTQLLLGIAPGRIQTLHVLEQPIEMAETRAHQGFPRQLSDAINKMRGQDVG